MASRGGNPWVRSASIGEVDHQDRVLFHDADEENDADERNDGEVRRRPA